MDPMADEIPPTLNLLVGYRDRCRREGKREREREKVYVSRQTETETDGCQNMICQQVACYIKAEKKQFTTGKIE